MCFYMRIICTPPVPTGNRFPSKRLIKEAAKRANMAAARDKGLFY